MSEQENQPIIGLVVDSKESKSKPRLVGFELSFYIGKRILIAAFATVILSFSLISVKASKDALEQKLTVEYREEPNFVMAAVALYLLGVATDFDLTLPLKMLRGSNSKDGQ